jgi:quercetin dioxygenase-like cupin family protein
MKASVGHTLLVIGMSACAAAIAQSVPDGAVMFQPDKAKWGPGSTPGVESSAIYGSPTKPGRYLQVAKFPPNFVLKPHAHPDERYSTVLSGTWYIGFGTTFDESKLIALPAGSFYTEPANLPHFVATKADGAVVQIGGHGPTRQIWANPADDPGRK